MTRIVFDLDGTLIDSAEDVQGIANAILPPDLPPVTLPEVRAFMGEGTPTFIRRLIDARDLPTDSFDTLHKGFMARYKTAVTRTTVYPGVAETLSDLRAAGHRLGLCTNKPAAPARAVLAHLGLAEYFDVLLGGDSLPQRKPDPAPLLAILANLGDTRALYVGDSETDAETAHAAAVPFLLFTEGYPKGPTDKIACTARFSSFSALPGLVAQLG
ncbi:phosphoglycolate phosphatase [Pseudooceanicola sediminis]|uniref:phosphoglycolate phosphatase n=1 Tax=Pseudooceanicola sediminis TaxID=2211117 RepID=A0A399IUX0_9RHOB|nr:phosphoglycolate phosphatase [Pseudooceanicola sediminis]KAA2314920.1 phosphoglycolate phosphatase [Puniceibacterium sp. HSS470]RII36945.1 phosphoglycolate phosphatase [Pseudooceanicola sediminis]|tara:strand:+ start:17553 stop:18194 length:642 start_codon:yes stop_codon:yes gene_type:complete